MKPIHVGRSHRHEERRCPKCGHSLDASTSLGHDAAPSVGDVTFCIECLAILIFDERLTLRSPSAVELCALKTGEHWETLERARTAMREINARMKTSP